MAGSPGAEARELRVRGPVADLRDETLIRLPELRLRGRGQVVGAELDYGKVQPGLDADEAADSRRLRVRLLAAKRTLSGRPSGRFTVTDDYGCDEGLLIASVASTFGTKPVFSSAVSIGVAMVREYDAVM